MEVYKYISSEIKKLEVKLSYVAEKTGISQSHLSNLMSGKRTMRDSHLHLLSKFLMEEKSKKGDCKKNKLFKDEILKQNITQVDVAERMGIKKSHLNNILSCRENLLPKHIDKLNEILGTKY